MKHNGMKHTSVIRTSLVYGLITLSVSLGAAGNLTASHMVKVKRLQVTQTVTESWYRLRPLPKLGVVDSDQLRLVRVRRTEGHRLQDKIDKMKDQKSDLEVVNERTKKHGMYALLVAAGCGALFYRGAQSDFFNWAEDKYGVVGKHMPTVLAFSGLFAGSQALEAVRSLWAARQEDKELDDKIAAKQAKIDRGEHNISEDRHIFGPGSTSADCPQITEKVAADKLFGMLEEIKFADRNEEQYKKEKAEGKMLETNDRAFRITTPAP